MEPISDDITSVINILKQYSDRLTFVGDGAVAHRELLTKEFENCNFASDAENEQTSISIGASAYEKYNSSNYTPVYTLSPIYLKKSQAEINLENRNKG